METENTEGLITYKSTEKEVLYLNTHDKLTGLYNRSYFENIIKKAERNGQCPISLVVADINGLKIINKVFGFETGDLLIRKTADVLAKAAGPGSVTARWGEDEFSIIYTDTDEEDVEIKCSQLLKECGKINENQIKPSLAIGNATRKNPNQTISQILLEAEERMYRNKLLESQSTYSSVITSLRKAMFQKSSETEEHAKRMLKMSKMIGKKIGLSRDELDSLCLLSVLHDIGKIAISDQILYKPGMLSDNEWKEMRKHSEIGYKIASACNELSTIAECILSHHERWDGNGYPQGLKGNEIPKLSRIIAILDTYDAITNERPYRAASSHEDAIKEIRNCSGAQFEPDIVDMFCRIFSE